MPELKDKCVTPARGPMVPPMVAQEPGAVAIQEVRPMLARVGRPAPDFEASAFVAGQGFQPVKLSDYKGKWIVICFYPGDFTFV
jgi:hypothetical protein